MPTGIDPNKRLIDYLDKGTEELRSYLSANVVSNSNHELERLQQYHLYWKFYDGYHYRDFNHTMISFNYVKAFIDKVISFLMGTSGMSFKVTSYYNDNLDEKITKPVEELILSQWRRNNKSLVAHEIVQMGAVSGDVWIMPTWDTTKKFVRINTLDSRQCFPIFKNGDYNQLEGFQVRQVLTTNTDQTANNEYRLQVTYYTKDNVETWKQKTAAIVKPHRNFLDSTKFNNDVHEYSATPNPLGFIPVVHIKNKPNSGGYFGKSDAHDILKLNKVYNELNQEMKGIIDYHATPTTVVTGATIKNMKRSLGNVWSGLPAEANVFTLGLDADLSAMTTFMEKLKTGMHEISDVPENVLGKLQSISGTSAAALQLTFQPLVQQADLKSLTYGEGFAELNEMILQILFKYDKANPRLKGIEIAKFIDGGDLRVEPVFNYGFPSDRMNLLQEMQIEEQLGIGSKEEFMNRLGKNNVPDLLEKIGVEKVADAQMQAEIDGYVSSSIQQQEPISAPAKTGAQK